MPDLEQRIARLEQRMDRVEKEREALQMLATALGQQVKDMNDAVESIRPVVLEMQETQKIAKAVSESQARFLSRMGRLLIYTSTCTAAIVGTIAAAVKLLGG